MTSRKTVFKDKVSGKMSRGTASDLRKKTRCFRCGKLGHISRDCKSEPSGGKGEQKGSSSGSKHFFQFQSSPASYLFNGQAQNSSLGVSKDSDSKHCDSEKCVASQVLSNVKAYPVMFVGLSTLPCHGLVDTGAQDGVVGLWHWQRWMVCLAQCFHLQPVFQPLPEFCEAGGIGGAAKPLAICDIPTGLAGIDGLSRWVVLDDPHPDHRTPPLLPIKLLKALDAVHESKYARLTLREANVTVQLASLEPSEHQTCSMMLFSPEGWELPEHLQGDFPRVQGSNPFVFDPLQEKNDHAPMDSRLNISELVNRSGDFVEDKVLESLRYAPERREDILSGPAMRPDPLSGLAAWEPSGPVVNFPAQTSLVPQYFSSKEASKHLKWPKDEWKKGTGCWIRIHNRPRRALFAPTGTIDGPDIRVLSGVRSTKVNFCDGSPSEVIGDDWLTVATQQRCLSRRWTGCSIFPMGTPMDKDYAPPRSSQARVSNCQQGSRLGSQGVCGTLVDSMLGVLFAAQPDPPETPVERPLTSDPPEEDDSNDPLEIALRYRTQVTLQPELIDVFVSQGLELKTKCTQVDSTSQSGSAEEKSCSNGLCGAPDVQEPAEPPGERTQTEAVDGGGRRHPDSSQVEAALHDVDVGDPARRDWPDDTVLGEDAPTQSAGSLGSVRKDCIKLILPF